MTDRDEHTAVIGMVSETALREQLAAEIARLRHDIERHLAITTEQQTEIERLRAQRDELLAALKTLLDPLALSQPAPLPNLAGAITRARAAIAALETES